MIANRAYTVSDGEMVLTLEPAKEGGYVVTSPLELERHLRDRGCILHHHGGNHDV